MDYEIKTLAKLVLLVFLSWLFVTYIPNHLLREWWFLLLVFALFFYSARWARKQFKGNFFLNTLILGLIFLDIAVIVLNKLGV